MPRKDTAWKSATLANKYLQTIRGVIPLASEQLDVMIRAITSLTEVNRFLDLGCGSGILSSAILDRFPKACGALVDFSGPMLAAAREQLAAYADNLTFVDADLASPSWVKNLKEKAPYNVIVSGFALHHLTDERKKQIYTEIHDLLQPGGIFLNIEHVASATPWVESLFETLFIDRLYEKEQGGARTREELGKEYYHREDKKANILALVEHQCQWLRDIGYQDVDCYFKILELAVFGGRRAPKVP